MGLEGQVGPEGAMGPMGPEGLEGPEGPIGLEGEKGEQGERGLKGEKGAAGKDGKDGKDGVDGEVDTKEVRDLIDGGISKHEKAFDHKNLHSPFTVGTLTVDESSKGDGKIQVVSGEKLVYRTLPKNLGKMIHGGRVTSPTTAHIYVQTAQPTDPRTFDLWLDLN